MPRDHIQPDELQATHRLHQQINSHGGVQTHLQLGFPQHGEAPQVYVCIDADDIEEVVKEDRYLTIKDLMVEPVNFKNGVYDVVKDFAFNITDKDEDYEA